MAQNPQYHAVLEEMARLHDAKNHDYAEEGNPYSNFEGAARVVGLTVDQVFHTLLAIKVERLRQLAAGGKTPNFEPKRDTILDFAVYAALWVSWLDGGAEKFDDCPLCVGTCLEPPDLGERVYLEARFYEAASSPLGL